MLARIGLCVRDLDDWQPVADCVPDLSMRNGKAETWRNRSFPPRIKPAEKRRPPVVRRVASVRLYSDPELTLLTAPAGEPRRRKADDEVPCDRAVTMRALKGRVRLARLAILGWGR